MLHDCSGWPRRASDLRSGSTPCAISSTRSTRIYRFAVDQTGMDRGELLELTVVLILLLELVLFFLGVMR